MGFNPMNLDTRAASDAGIWVTLTDVDGNEVWEDDKPVQFKITGRDSAAAKEAAESMANKSGEMLDRTTKEAMIKCLKGWSDNITDGEGKPLKFSAANSAKIVAIPHIQDWLMREIMNRANFMKKPRTK